MLQKTQSVQHYATILKTLTELIKSSENGQLEAVVDYGYYKNRISLVVTQRFENDPRTVQIVSGPGLGELNVAYFSNQSIITGSFDPFGLKAAEGEGGVAKEYRHTGFLNVGADEASYGGKMVELCMHIVQFLWSGELLDKNSMLSQHATLGTTVEDITEPKLR